jgi:single-strand DNA-binding protein
LKTNLIKNIRALHVKQKEKTIMAFSTNLRNFGTAEGRLVADPAKFTNSDGSVKVKLSLAVNDTFKKADGTQSTQIIAFEAFIAKEAGGNLGPYTNLEKGDKIGVGYSVRSNTYTDKNGETVYAQVLQINAVDFKETPNEKEARKGRKATANAVAAAAASVAPVAAPVDEIPVAPEFAV